MMESNSTSPWTQLRLSLWQQTEDRAICLCRPDGSVIWQNDAVIKLLGSAVSELGDMAPGGEQRSLLVEEARRLTHGDGTVTLVLRGQYRDNQSATMRYRLARCPQPDSTLLVTMADITDLEVLTRQLSEKERSQSFLKSATSSLLIRLDPDWRILWRNDAAASLLPDGDTLVSFLDEATAQAMEDWIQPWRTAQPTDSQADSMRECVLNSAPGLEPRWQLRGVGRILVDEEGRFQGTSLILHDESDSGRVQQFAKGLGLSPREEEILQYLVTGYSNLNMAMILGLSESGVKFHVKNIMAKARVSSRTELLAQLFRL